MSAINAKKEQKINPSFTKPLILKEPSLFDAEDITAMNLSIHKSLLRALDQGGIDSSRLRLKGEFHSGRRRDTVLLSIFPYGIAPLALFASYGT